MNSDPYAALGDLVSANDPYAALGDVVSNGDQPRTAASGDPLTQEVRRRVLAGQSAHEIHAFLQSQNADANVQGLDQAVAFRDANPKRAGEISFVTQPNGNQQAVAPTNGNAPSSIDALARGLSHGLIPGSDYISAGLNSIVPLDALGGRDVESMWGGRSIGDAFQHNLDLERTQNEYNHIVNPGLDAAGTIGGAVLSPINKVGAPVAAAANLGKYGTLALEGALGGAAYGGLTGATSEDNHSLADVASNAGQGALWGGALGGLAYPAAGAVAGRGSAVVTAARRAFGGGDANVGAQVVASRLAADGINPTDAANMIYAGAKAGTPVFLADLGENTRALAGSVSRQPGAARNIAMTATMERQAGQGDRIRDAINSELGPTTDVLAESNRLIDQARAAAAPLYEKAYAAPPISSPRLQQILNTPAAKQALSRAVTIAANEERDPKALGFVVDKAGNVVLDPTVTATTDAAGNLALSQSPAQQQGYTAQTLDYVKRGLDDIIEQYRNPVTGKLQLDEAGNAINGVKNNLLAELDNLNPDYAAARAAYAGPASLKSAMLDGQKALNKSASEINQRIANMNDAERAQYALGLRSAMADAVSSGVDGGNKAARLINSQKKRDALAAALGNSADLDSFMARLGHENAAYDTYSAVNRGSPSATRLAEDAFNSGLNGASPVLNFGQALMGGRRAVADYLWRGAGNAFNFGVGKAGERAREDASALLFSGNPLSFEQSLASGAKADARRNAFLMGAGRATGRAGANVTTLGMHNDLSPAW